MKSSVEKISPTRVTMTVEVPEEELKPYVDDALKSIGQQIQVPGFRAGKVPSRLIEQRVGKGAVMQEAVNAALPEFWAQAAAENELQPIGQPEVDVTEVPLEDSTQLTFTVAVDVRPEITLPDYASMTIEVDPVTVSDEDVEARMTDLRERFGSLTGVDRAVEDGDFVSIDLTASIDGEEIDSVEGISYEVGSKTMLEGLDEALVGLAKGESKDFTAPLAGGEHAGKDADCTVAVQSVKVRELPEVDDDFASMASEFDTVEELRADLTAQAEQQKKFEQGLQARDRLLDALLEQTEIAVPESIVEDEVKNHLEGEGRADDAEHRAEVEENTRKAIRTQFLLDEIVRVEEIEVGQQELVEYLLMQAQQYGMDPNQFAQLIDQQDQIPAMMGEVARRKGLAAVFDGVSVVDTEGTPIDLDDLVPDADQDDETADAGTEQVSEVEQPSDGEGDAQPGAGAEQE